jgi:hypothetical protein
MVAFRIYEVVLGHTLNYFVYMTICILFILLFRQMCFECYSYQHGGRKILVYIGP